VRWSALIICAWLWSGCNTVADSNGNQPDGGIAIHKVQCPPGQVYDWDVGCIIPESCAAPCPNPLPSGQVCVTGSVVDLATMKHLPFDMRALRIGVYESVDFLSDPNPTPLAEQPSTTTGCFTFNFAVPSTSLFTVVVQDPQGTTRPDPLVIGAVGFSATAGNRYEIDAFLVEKALLDNWSGVDPAFASAGSVVDCFYAVAADASNDLLFDESWPPVSGVQLIAKGRMGSAIGYLNQDATIDSAATATGPSGCAVVTSGSYTAQGGSASRWQTTSSGSKAGAVLVQIVKSCDGAPAGSPGCN
jgi:hypothetical protein